MIKDKTGKWSIRVTHLTEKKWPLGSHLMGPEPLKTSVAALFKGNREMLVAYSHVRPGDVPVKKYGYRQAVTRVMEAAKLLYNVEFEEYRDLENELFVLEERYWPKSRQYRLLHTLQNTLYRFGIGSDPKLQKAINNETPSR